MDLVSNEIDRRFNQSGIKTTALREDYIMDTTIGRRIIHSSHDLPDWVSLEVLELRIEENFLIYPKHFEMLKFAAFTNRNC